MRVAGIEAETNVRGNELIKYGLCMLGNTDIFKGKLYAAVFRKADEIFDTAKTFSRYWRWLVS